MLRDGSVAVSPLLLHFRGCSPVLLRPLQLRVFVYFPRRVYIKKAVFISIVRACAVAPPYPALSSSYVTLLFRRELSTVPLLTAQPNLLREEEWVAVGGKRARMEGRHPSD